MTYREIPRKLDDAKISHFTVVSMIRKHHNHKLQTTPWHREEEPLNHHETPGIKQSNQPALPHQAHRIFKRLAKALIRLCICAG